MKRTVLSPGLFIHRFGLFGFSGRAKEVTCEEETDLSLILTITTQQEETVRLRALLKEEGDGYCLSGIEVTHWYYKNGDETISQSRYIELWLPIEKA